MPVEWIVTVLVVVSALACIAGYLFMNAREWKEKWKEQARRKIRAELIEELNTAELPIVQRYSAPLPDIDAALEKRLLRRPQGNKHYPFILPTTLDPVTPLPDVMKVPSRIKKVVMRANDWVECRDQYGFVMNDYSGLYDNVKDLIMQQYDGDWLVPKQMTGLTKVVRFKRVRPQDFRSGPPRHPRELPDVQAPKPEEMSPLF